MVKPSTRAAGVVEQQEPLVLVALSFLTVLNERTDVPLTSPFGFASTALALGVNNIPLTRTVYEP